MIKLTIGQELWWVSQDRKKQGKVTVTEIDEEGFSVKYLGVNIYRNYGVLNKRLFLKPQLREIDISQAVDYEQHRELNRSRKRKWTEQIYPYNLLESIINEDSVLYTDGVAISENEIENRIKEVLDLFPNRTKQILNMRFIDRRAFQEIGDEFDLSRERIRQLINKSIRRLRSKKILPYLLGNSDILEIKKKSFNVTDNLALYEDIAEKDFPTETKICLTNIANRMSANETGRLFTFKEIKEFLVSKGLLQEGTSEMDSLLRRPTSAGIHIGITIEKRKNSAGKEYEVIVFDREAQQYILDNINKFDEIIKKE